MTSPRPAPLTVPQPDLGAIRGAVRAALADGDLWTANRIAAKLRKNGLSPSAEVLRQVLADLEACRLIAFEIMGDAHGYCLTPCDGGPDSRYPPHVIEPAHVEACLYPGCDCPTFDGFEAGVCGRGLSRNHHTAGLPIADMAHWSENRRPGPEKPARYATPIQQMTANLAATAARNAADAAILRDLARLFPPRIAAVLERAAARLT